MEDDDYKLSPCGSLGGKTRVVKGFNVIGEFKETETALQAVSDHMEENGYGYLTIWWVSDHGNYWQIDIKGNEVKLNNYDEVIE